MKEENGPELPFQGILSKFPIARVHGYLYGLSFIYIVVKKMTVLSFRADSSIEIWSIEDNWYLERVINLQFYMSPIQPNQDRVRIWLGYVLKCLSWDEGLKIE